MINYEVRSNENGSKITVKAQGVVEAIAEHLSHPVLELSVTYSPNHGISIVTDNKTGIKYDVRII